MRSILNYAFYVIGKVLLLAQKTYWFFWRRYLLTQFKSCGEGVYLGRNCIFTCENISIGNDVYIGNNACFQSVHGQIKIGNHVMFGPNVHIHGGDHKYNSVGVYMKSITDKVEGEDGIVNICDDVWIGAGATILKGVTIGEGCIIGAGSIINKDVEPYTIVVGALPRRELKRFDDKTIQKHREILQNGRKS
ncbi:acyltransferase [Robertmurraya korlensis]|uniref:acyltransferase n=1 Tax=Robertmurraya korlensis TaxID=519977 RepID=UPI00082463BA|nr:acyltransferase [Robertmurraya korlensis]